MSTQESRICYTPGSDVALEHRGTTLWRYHFTTERRKPYFHPVTTPDGVELTCFEPWDHWWHRGLWFSWQFINGVNYWEEDIEEMGPKGSLEFVGPEDVEAGPDLVIVRTHYHYHPELETVVMHDARVVTIGMPEANGHFTMDWDLAFTPTVDLTIDRVQEEWGGYSGLSWRTSRGMGDFRLVNSEGQAGADTQHQPAKWVDLAGKGDGGRDKVGGMAFMIHPSTPRIPASWKTFGDPGFGYINPSPVMDEPLALKAGEVLRLRYRVLVHSGALSTDALEEAYTAYCTHEA